MEERIQKILARAGYGSRRQCEELIQYGRVKVNGNSVELGAKADPEQDTITVDGKKIPLEEFNFRYIALNKPRNVLSDCDSFGERKTVHDLVGLQEHLFAVGRLDFDSEGLILMTNDGDLANKLTHPRYGHEKEYQVKVAKKPDAQQLTTWRRGVVLEDGYRTAPAIVQITKSDTNSAWLKVILKEGRKRQIREIGQLIGLPVQRIIRVRISTLHLGDLKPGVWRDLTAKEVKELKASAGALRQDRKRPSSSRTYKTRTRREDVETGQSGQRTYKPRTKREDGETIQSGQRAYKPRTKREDRETIPSSSPVKRRSTKKPVNGGYGEKPANRNSRPSARSTNTKRPRSK